MVTMWRQNKVRHLVFKSKQSSFFKTTFIVLINNVLRKKNAGSSFFTNIVLIDMQLHWIFIYAWVYHRI